MTYEKLSDYMTCIRQNLQIYTRFVADEEKERYRTFLNDEEIALLDFTLGFANALKLKIVDFERDLKFKYVDFFPVEERHKRRSMDVAVNDSLLFAINSDFVTFLTLLRNLNTINHERFTTKYSQAKSSFLNSLEYIDKLSESDMHLVERHFKTLIEDNQQVTTEVETGNAEESQA